MDIVNRILQYIVYPAIGFLFILALAYFLWGVLQYFLWQGSDEQRAQGGKHIMWGLIGFLIMLGFLGIMQIIGGTFGQTVPNPLPGFSPPDF